MDLGSLTGGTLRGIFSPPSMGGQLNSGAVLSTYQGPMRDRVLGFFERIGKVPEGVAEAARQGAAPLDIGRAVQAAAAGVPAGAAQAAGNGAQTLGLAAGSGALPAAIRVVGYGDPAAQSGMLARQLVAEQAHMAGIPLAAVQIVPAGTQLPLAATSVAPAAVEAAAASLPAATRVSAAAGSGLAHADEMQSFVSQALAQLGKAEPTMRMDILAQAVTLRAKAGTGEPIEALLARSLAEAPVDESSRALAQAIDEVTAVKVAASSADDVARVASSVDDVARIATVAEEAMPAAAKIVAEAAPAITAAARSLPLAAASAGRLMSMEAAIVEALRMLPKV